MLVTLIACQTISTLRHTPLTSIFKAADDFTLHTLEHTHEYVIIIPASMITQVPGLV